MNDAVQGNIDISLRCYRFRFKVRGPFVTMATASLHFAQTSSSRRTRRSAYGIAQDVRIGTR